MALWKDAISRFASFESVRANIVTRWVSVTLKFTRRKTKVMYSRSIVVSATALKFVTWADNLHSKFLMTQKDHVFYWASCWISEKLRWCWRENHAGRRKPQFFRHCGQKSAQCQWGQNTNSLHRKIIRDMSKFEEEHVESLGYWH